MTSLATFAPVSTKSGHIELGMKLTLREFGGVGGLRGRPRASVNTRQLSTQARDELEKLVRELMKDAEHAARPPGDEPHSGAYDALSYDIVVEDDDSAPTTLVRGAYRQTEFDRLRRRLVEFSMTKPSGS